MNKLAIFASGSGTNAQNLCEYFNDHENFTIDCILSNKTTAYVLERAKTLGIDSLCFSRQQFYDEDFVSDYLRERRVDWIILAGFLWLVPLKLIKQFPNRIINIHPALLPKFGGKGMYGIHVHKAVLEKEEKESGITIHYVNENYDEGQIIFQAKCQVDKNDTPESLASKIHSLEYTFFPRIIEKEINQKDRSN